MSNERVNPFTEIALEAVDELNDILVEVIAEWSVPLGMQVVPSSTRRGRMKRQAEDMATMLVRLSQEFGADQVQEVLGLPLPEGGTLFEGLVSQYGEETVARAMALVHLGLMQTIGTPDEQQYLPA